MDLREGSGNEYKGGLFGRPTEDDLLNVVWVVDSGNLPFYRVSKRNVVHDSHNCRSKKLLKLINMASYTVCKN